MKKLITVLLTVMLFIASTAYANCYLKEVDVNNKFEFEYVAVIWLDTFSAESTSVNRSIVSLA
jgi:hypothetical protein